MADLKQNLRELHIKLANKNLTGLSTTIGFDGFVDEIIDVVDKRHSFDSYTRMNTIAEFGARISRAADLSTNIEFVPRNVKLGGNGPIMANAMMAAGVDVYYIGSIGKPTIHPVFQELVDGCREVFPLAEPGHTDAVEFNDGKVMLGKHASLKDINWANLVETIDESRIAELFTKSDLVATVNWTMTPYMNELWKNLLAILDNNLSEEKPLFFVDLADPEKRKDEDIREALTIIEKFNAHYRVVLGLNRKEASEVARVLNLPLTAAPEQVSLEEIVRAIDAKLNIWCTMVHPSTGAAAIIDGDYAHTVGPYTSKPRLMTGAGDNFNSGFCLGLLFGLSLSECLMLGTASSGFYVRNMYSPSFAELKSFILTWAEYGENEF